MTFAERLLNWYHVNGRDLPWRDSRDPYAVWISEIILQQTRISQGLPYYYRFLDAFPDVHALAAAPEGKVLRLWQGLGYYSRARNLHAAVRQVATDFHGKLPDSYNELIKLKGVGPYTAAAIASIAFNEVVATLDGNVMRILARMFAIDEKTDTGKGKKVFEKTASQLIPACCPGDFNQAMMDFGSMVCTPRNPLCAGCLFNHQCLAFHAGKVHDFPKKGRKKPPGKRFFHYFFIRTDAGNENGIFITQRKKKDIWQNMYEFPMIEDSRELSATELLVHKKFHDKFPGVHFREVMPEPMKLKHQLSHQTIYAFFFFVYAYPADTPVLKRQYLLRTPGEIEDLAKPRPIDRFLREHVF